MVPAISTCSCIRLAFSLGWGVNGVVFNTWTSFRCDPDGFCRLVDSADWRTGIWVAPPGRPFQAIQAMSLPANYAIENTWAKESHLHPAVDVAERRGATLVSPQTVVL